MAQQINDNFSLLAGIPLDDRNAKTTIGLRDAIPATLRFEGLLCYVSQTNTLYQLQGGIENSNWIGIAGNNVTSDFETEIEGFLALSAGKTTLNAWEVGDKFRGWIGTRYVVGSIVSLPVSLPSNIDDPTKVSLEVDSNETSGFELLSNKATDFSTVNNILYPSVQAVKTQLDLKVDKVNTIVYAKDYANLNAAVLDIGLNEATLLITENETTNANLTIPSNISLKIVNGGSITKNSTNTINIDGYFDAGIYNVFDSFSEGDIKFGKAAVKEVYPQWWGENTSQGVTNMTLPIQSAISSLVLSGGTVKIPIGLYLVDSLTIPYVDGVFRAITIEGDGKWNLDSVFIYHNGTQLISNSAVPIFAPVDHSDGVTLRNMVLNGNNIGTYGWYGLYGSFTTIENCVFTKFTTIGSYTAQGLCQFKYNYVNSCGIGVKFAGDGIFEHNKIVSNIGNGVIFSTGGNFFSDNEVANNGGVGLYIDGTLGNNSNIVINNNYFENNLGWHVVAEGDDNSNRTVSKLRITGNFFSGIGVPNGNTNGGVKLLNTRSSNVANNNYIGSSGWINTNEQNAILLENSDLISITNLVAENGYRNAIKVVNSQDINIGEVALRDFAVAATSTDDAYGIYILSLIHI